MNVLPERLKQSREKKGLNQRQVASKLNISQSSVALQEKDRRNIDSSLLLAYAALYNVSTDYLLGITDDPIPYADGKVSDADLEKTLEALKQKKARWGNSELSDEDQDMLADIIEAIQKRRQTS